MASDKLKSGTLPAEPGTKLMLKLAGISEQIKCTLVGVEPGDSIIVRLPATVGESWKFSERRGCVVRFLSQGTVYGFNTYVQGKYVKEPLRFLFLAFPVNLEVHNLRGSQRIACHLPARLELGGENLEGVIVDIGAGGASFVYRMPHSKLEPPAIHLGKQVNLVCPLWGLPGEQVIDCQVRNFSLDLSILSMGMAFAQNHSKIIGHIKEYVARVQKLLQEQSQKPPRRPRPAD
jgi:hypothetical protein